MAVMALERVPADIRKEGGVARMSDAEVIRAIKAAVTIPVMAKARIGHFVEAQILEALEVDYIDESEVRPCKKHLACTGLLLQMLMPHITSLHACTACWMLVPMLIDSLKSLPQSTRESSGCACMFGVAGADAGGRCAPHQQAQLQGTVRVRLPRPGRGAAPHF